MPNFIDSDVPLIIKNFSTPYYNLKYHNSFVINMVFNLSNIEYHLENNLVWMRYQLKPILSIGYKKTSSLVLQSLLIVIC